MSNRAALTSVHGPESNSRSRVNHSKAEALMAFPCSDTTPAMEVMIVSSGMKVGFIYQAASCVTDYYSYVSIVFTCNSIA